MKEKVAKQLNKNKALVAKAMGVIPVVGEDRVANALNLAPVLGLSWGGEDKKLRNLVEATIPKVKGMRKLKNLDCTISLVKARGDGVGWDQKMCFRSLRRCTRVVCGPLEMFLLRC